MFWNKNTIKEVIILLSLLKSLFLEDPIMRFVKKMTVDAKITALEKFVSCVSTERVKMAIAKSNFFVFVSYLLHSKLIRFFAAKYLDTNKEKDLNKALYFAIKLQTKTLKNIGGVIR